MTNPNSILDSTKQVLGVADTDTSFDLDVTMLVNSAFGSLSQLGVGSDSGFVITDNTTLWSQYISDLVYLGMIKQFIFMTVKLAFDPPGTSFGLEAIQNQLQQLAWRINVKAEEITPPSDPFAPEEGPGGDGVTTVWFKVKVMDLTFASTITPNAGLANTFRLTLTGDCTLNAPVGAKDGEHITLYLTSNNHSVAWGSGWNFGAAGVPDLSSSATDVISAVWNEAAAEWFAGFTAGF